MKDNNKRKIKWSIIIFGTILAIGLIIASFNKSVQATMGDLQGRFASFNELENKYLLDELKEEYDEVKQIANTALENKNSDEAKNAIEKIVEFTEKVLEYNNKLYEDKLLALNNEDIKEFKEEWKSKLQLDIKAIEEHKEKGEFKLAINKINESVEYINSNRAILEKEKQAKLDEEKKKAEEEKKKQEEEKKKQEEANKNPQEEANKEAEQSFVSNLKVANTTDKIITVVGTGGSSAEVKYHKKVNGLWKEVIGTRGFVGYNGIGNKVEGDGKTPSGVYTFGFGFGIANNPGSRLPYRKVTPNDYWVDDSNSKYYNQWVNTNEVEKDWNSAEHLMSYKTQYKYGVTINYNTSNTPGKGSAIFLHCAVKNTAGCVGVPESVMVKLLGEIDSNTKIVIARNRNDINKY